MYHTNDKRRESGTHSQKRQPYGESAKGDRAQRRDRRARLDEVRIRERSQPYN